jgi:hypothetical protein
VVGLKIVEEQTRGRSYHSVKLGMRGGGPVEGWAGLDLIIYFKKIAPISRNALKYSIVMLKHSIRICFGDLRAAQRAQRRRGRH